MADAPKTTRFNADDYPDAPEWFQRHIEVLNKFTATVALALDSQLTRTANLKSERKSITFDTKATVGDTFPLDLIKHGIDGLVNTVLLSQITPMTAGDTLTSAVTLTWERTPENKVKILYVTGLNASKRYKLDLIFEAD